jgi:hypothetical protein
MTEEAGSEEGVGLSRIRALIAGNERHIQRLTEQLRQIQEVSAQAFTMLGHR